MSPGATVSIPHRFAGSADRAAVGAVARPIAIGVAIAAAALTIRVGFGVHVDGLDDAGYLDAAQRVARGGSLDNLFPLFRTRVGMAYPLGWLLQAGWLAPHQFWILTMLAECVTLASLAIAGWLLTGRRAAGLWAAAIYAIYPLAVQQSAMFYPTAFQVASIAAAVATLAIADRAAATRSRLLLGLLAGLSLGVGYLFKEDVAIVVPALALASLIARWPRPTTALAMCGGAAVVFGVECVAYWQTTGTPLFRLTATSGLGAPLAGQLQIAEIWRWDAFLRSLLVLPVQVGLIWWAAIVAVVHALRNRSRSPGAMFVATAFLIVMAYLQFGSGSLSSYSPLPKTPRYTALATPFLMLVVGAWVVTLFAQRPRAARLVVAAIVAAAAPSLLYLNLSSSERTRNTMAVVPALQQVGGGTLLTDYYSARVLRVLAPDAAATVWYHAKFDENRTLIVNDPAAMPGAYVLLDRQAAKIYTSSYELALPPSVDAPPAHWQVIWTHRAYQEGTLMRTLLESLRAGAAKLPSGNPLSSRVTRAIGDMIDGDQATLYRVTSSY